MIIDTGPIVAAVNRRDGWHHACAELLTTYPGPLVLPEALLSEIGYLLGNHVSPSAEAEFLRNTIGSQFDVVPTSDADRLRMASLVDTYDNLPLGTADASVIALAERLNISTVATLDRKHFSIVRPRHVPAFELVP